MSSRFVNTLDNPPRFLFWQMDDFLSLLVPFFLGIILSSLSFVLLAPVTKWAYSRLKQKFGGHKFKALCYWHLPSDAFFGQIKHLPPSHQRCFFL